MILQKKAKHNVKAWLETLRHSFNAVIIINKYLSISLKLQVVTPDIGLYFFLYTLVHFVKTCLINMF